MHISHLKNSKFLAKQDCEPAILRTISGVNAYNVAMENAPEELKHCLEFEEEGTKPMVLNSTNAQLIAQITGSDETDEWVGQKVVLFNDPSIAFQGRLVGGIRVRAPKKQAAVPAKPAGKANAKPAARKPVPEPEPEPEVQTDPDDDTPF
jgi:hypothetical protein